MASNYVQNGKVVDYKNTGTDPILSGSVVLMGKMVGVAVTGIAPGKTGAVQVEEVFKLPKKAADAFAIGDVVYWNATDNEMVKVATGNTAAGKAFADAPANSASVNVKLNV